MLEFGYIKKWTQQGNCKMPEDIKKVKLAIIGGGPVGLSAAIYAGEAGL